VDNFNIRVRALVRVEERKLVQHNRHQRRTTKTTEAGTANLNRDPIVELNRLARLPHNELLKNRALAQDAANIIQHHRGLRLRRRQAQGNPLLTRYQLRLVIAETRDVAEQRRNGPGLATTTASYHPQLRNTIWRQLSAASEAIVMLKLSRPQLLAHAVKQQRTPRSPAVTSERAAQQVGIR